MQQFEIDAIRTQSQNAFNSAALAGRINTVAACRKAMRTNEKAAEICAKAGLCEIAADHAEIVEIFSRAIERTNAV